MLGLQLDERRIVNEITKKKVKKSIWRTKIRRYRSELLWYQLEHVCRVLDNEHLPAWDHIGIGSDFDGIIDSLNGFWTAEELPALAGHLKVHADNFLSSYTFKNASNHIDSGQLITKVMYTNARAFLEKHFINQGAIT